MREQTGAVTRAAVALGGLLLVALSMIANAPTAGAQTGSPIADAALARLGTHGGQCWTFMQTVVAEATGARVGFAYRQGYFDAGAVEVTPSEAAAGDIIQISSDRAPTTYFPGVHTAIILENLGGGRFDAIDSNQNWDEWVRLRPNYDPFAAAARYGLQVHIYRFSGGSSGGGIAATIPDAPAVASGQAATVATTGDCLNLRNGPELGSSRIGCLPNGTALTVIGEAVAADGYSWVQVESPMGTGWVAANYISGSAAAEPVVETVSVEPEAPAAVSTDAGASSSGYPVNWIHTDNSPGCLRLRSAAGSGSSILDCLPAGTAVTLISDANIVSDGYVWVNVRTEHGGIGWLASEHLVP